MLCSIIHIIYICKSDFECVCCPNGVAVATNEEHLSGYLVEPLDLPQTPGQIEIEVAGLNSDRSLDFHVFTRVKMANREPPGVMANLERRYAGVQTIRYMDQKCTEQTISHLLFYKASLF